MKKQISILLAAVLLSSCALQDKGGINPNADDDKVMSIEQVDTAEVSKLYEGYEELQGKQIGEHIVMPEVITPQEIDEIYTFEYKDNSNTENIIERGTEFFKRFFGDEFNENLLYVDPRDAMSRLRYNSNSFDTPEDKYDPDNDDGGAYDGYPVSARKTRAWYNSSVMTICEYDAVKDRSAEMELDNGKCTVGEICDTVQSFLDTEFEGLEGVDIVPFTLHYYSDTDNGNDVKRVFVRCGLMMNGVPCQDHFTSYSHTVNTADGHINTYYNPYYIEFILDGKDSILFLNPVKWPVKIFNETKVDKVITLSEAAKLLDENLAEKLVFKIEKVELIYCTKTDSHEFNEEGKEVEHTHYPYRPTWIFEFADGEASLNVDAISGEITIDATVDILNQMRREQGKT